MKLTSETKGLIYCILSGLLFGPIGYFGTLAMDAGLSIPNMLFWRYAVSLFFLFLILLPKIRFIRFEMSIFLFQIAIGIFFYAPFSLLYFKASKLIGTGLAMVIFFTYPAFVMGIRWAFFGKKIPKIYHASIVTIFCGMLLLMEVDSMKADIRGAIYALLSAILYAIYIVATNSKVSTTPPLTASITISLGGIIFAAIVGLIENSLSLPISLPAWQNLVGIGIISTALPILFLLEGLKYIEAEKASILAVLEPVLVFFIGIAALNEEVSFIQTIGALVILAGAILVQFDRRRNEVRTTQ